jgi:hypothetical protein
MAILPILCNLGSSQGPFAPKRARLLVSGLSRAAAGFDPLTRPKKQKLAYRSHFNRIGSRYNSGTGFSASLFLLYIQTLNNE